MEAITVVAVDDHYLIKEAIEGLARKHDEIELVASGSFGEDVLPLVEKHRPDVLLLDLSMPQHYGSQARFPALPAITKLRREYPETRIIVLSALTVPTLVKGALKQGVHGYLLKSDELSLSLPTAIRAVNRGLLYFSETINQMLLNHKEQKNVGGITSRQIEVLNTICVYPNASQAEIAALLGIEEPTVKSHLGSIYAALGVNNATAAILRAQELGLIDTKQGLGTD
jgi:DNA-binding NarL/FixJ family response regulator